MDAAAYFKLKTIKDMIFSLEGLIRTLNQTNNGYPDLRLQRYVATSSSNN